MNMKKKKKKRKLRVDRLLLVTISMAICIGISIAGITWIGNAIGDFIYSLQGETTTSTPQEPKASTITKESIIVLDAGHGGYDGGCEYGDYNEKTITLAVALKTGKMLEDAGYQVVYTRTSDAALGNEEFSDLSNRVNVGTRAQGDVFVSLHLNITENIAERVYGFEVYANEAMPASIALAENVIQEFEALNYSISRGILPGDFMHMVEENPLPAILVELGFLDDDNDRAFLGSVDGQTKLAQALARAIMKEYR